MSVALNWVSVTTSRDAKFMVKGVELANAICGTLCRFQICEHRAYTTDRTPTVIYRVRDAETVTDAQVRDGVRPKVVAIFDTFEDAFAFCETT